MTTVEDRLRDAAASLRPPSDAIPPFTRVQRRVRRRRVMMAATVVVVIAAASGAIATAAGRDRVVVTTPGPTSSSLRPPTHATAPVGLPTPVTTPTSDSFAVVSDRLEAYVAAEQARDSAAGTSSPANIWGDPVLAEQSAPVLERDTYFAVAAFSFDPDGRPVEVLAYADHTWSRVATLAAPTSPGTIVHAGALDLVAEQTPIEAADATADGRPDFLIDFAGGGCLSDAMVSQAGSPTGWRYVPFTGPFPSSEVLGGNPKFEGHGLESDNDCTAVALPPGQQHTWAWTYDPSSASFVGVQQPG